MTSSSDKNQSGRRRSTVTVGSLATVGLNEAIYYSLGAELQHRGILVAVMPLS
jgi:hypothetical protein